MCCVGNLDGASWIVDIINLLISLLIKIPHTILKNKIKIPYTNRQLEMG